MLLQQIYNDVDIALVVQLQEASFTQMESGFLSLVVLNIYFEYFSEVEHLF